MFNNKGIDVALGLVFIYLLYSLMASILQEIMARWLGLRQRNLVKAIRRMLQDQKPRSGSTLLQFLIEIGNNLYDYFIPLKKGSFLKAFYDHPSIKYLGENSSSSKPAYIDSADFARTVIQLLRGEKFNQASNQMQLIKDNLANAEIRGFKIQDETRESLRELWVDAANDIDRFSAGLEAWFNNTMDRATGWYKKQTQLFLFFIGIGVAVGFNVDSIAIGKILSTNETARKEMVNLAISKQKTYQEYVAAEKDTAITVSDEKTKKTEKLRIRYVAVGDTTLDSMKRELASDAVSTQQILGLGYYTEVRPEIKAKYQNSIYAAVAGWILSALAISLGAPFWFDLLNKIMMLRNAGNKPPDDSNKRKGNNALAPPLKPVG